MLDEVTLFSHAELLVDSSVSDLGEAVCEGVVNAEGAPLDHGFEIVKKVAVPIDDSLYLLRVVCRVFDTAQVTSEAGKRYVACWADAAWEPSSLTEALYEVLIGSNDNPPSPDLGVEIVHFRQPPRMFPELLESTPQ